MSVWKNDVVEDGFVFEKKLLISRAGARYRSPRLFSRGSVLVPLKARNVVVL